MTMPFVTRDVTVRGYAGSLAVSDGGAGNAAPVLLVHSFAGSADQWFPQLEHLRQTRRAVAFDWRAHGQSEASPTNDYSIQAVADDIDVVADKLGLDRFVLVGHSMGAAAAAKYAALHSDRVVALVLEGLGGKIDESVSGPMLEALTKHYDEQMTQFWGRLLADATPQTKARVMHDSDVLSREQILAMIHASFAYDPLPDVEKYDGPKLTILAQSGDTPYALHHLAPHLAVKIMDGTSHWTHLDKPEEFNRILDEFLDLYASAKGGV